MEKSILKFVARTMASISTLENESEGPSREYSSDEGIAVSNKKSEIKTHENFTFHKDTEDASESDMLHMDTQDTGKNR